jgi:hypothetical protein
MTLISALQRFRELLRSDLGTLGPGIQVARKAGLLEGLDPKFDRQRQIDYRESLALLVIRALEAQFAELIKPALESEAAGVLVKAPDDTEPDYYTMQPEAEGVWIRVNNLDVHVRRTDEGVVVDLYPGDQPDTESLASTYAHYSEAEIDEGDAQ